MNQQRYAIYDDITEEDSQALPESSDIYSHDQPIGEHSLLDSLEDPHSLNIDNYDDLPLDGASNNGDILVDSLVTPLNSNLQIANDTLDEMTSESDMEGDKFYIDGENTSQQFSAGLFQSSAIGGRGEERTDVEYDEDFDLSSAQVNDVSDFEVLPPAQPQQFTIQSNFGVISPKPMRADSLSPPQNFVQSTPNVPVPVFPSANNEVYSRRPPSGKSNDSTTKTPIRRGMMMSDSEGDASLAEDATRSQMEARLRKRRVENQQLTECLTTLQSDYQRTLTKLAEAELTVDQMRLGARVNLYSDVPPAARMIDSIGGGAQQPVSVNLGKQGVATVSDGYPAPKLSHQAQSLEEKLKSFCGLLDDGRLSKTDSRKVLDNLRKDYETLEREYVSTRDMSTGADDSDPLDAELFKLSLLLEEANGFVSKNLPNEDFEKQKDDEARLLEIEEAERRAEERVRMEAERRILEEKIRAEKAEYARGEERQLAEEKLRRQEIERLKAEERLRMETEMNRKAKEENERLQSQLRALKNQQNGYGDREKLELDQLAARLEKLKGNTGPASSPSSKGDRQPSNEDYFFKPVSKNLVDTVTSPISITRDSPKSVAPSQKMAYSGPIYSSSSSSSSPAMPLKIRTHSQPNLAFSQQKPPSMLSQEQGQPRLQSRIPKRRNSQPNIPVYSNPSTAPRISPSSRLPVRRSSQPDLDLSPGRIDSSRLSSRSKIPTPRSGGSALQGNHTELLPSKPFKRVGRRKVEAYSQTPGEENDSGFMGSSRSAGNGTSSCSSTQNSTPVNDRKISHMRKSASVSILTNDSDDALLDLPSPDVSIGSVQRRPLQRAQPSAVVTSTPRKAPSANFIEVPANVSSVKKRTIPRSNSERVLSESRNKVSDQKYAEMEAEIIRLRQQLKKNQQAAKQSPREVSRKEKPEDVSRKKPPPSPRAISSSHSISSDDQHFYEEIPTTRRQLFRSNSGRMPIKKEKKRAHKCHLDTSTDESVVYQPESYREQRRSSPTSERHLLRESFGNSNPLPFQGQPSNMNIPQSVPQAPYLPYQGVTNNYQVPIQPGYQHVPTRIHSQYIESTPPKNENVCNESFHHKSCCHHCCCCSNQNTTHQNIIKYAAPETSPAQFNNNVAVPARLYDPDYSITISGRRARDEHAARVYNQSTSRNKRSTKKYAFLLEDVNDIARQLKNTSRQMEESLRDHMYNNTQESIRFY